MLISKRITHEVVKMVQVLSIPKVIASVKTTNGLTKLIHCQETMV